MLDKNFYFTLRRKYNNPPRPHRRFLPFNPISSHNRHRIVHSTKNTPSHYHITRALGKYRYTKFSIGTHAFLASTCQQEIFVGIFVVVEFQKRRYYYSVYQWTEKKNCELNFITNLERQKGQKDNLFKLTKWTRDSKSLSDYY